MSRPMSRANKTAMLASLLLGSMSVASAQAQTVLINTDSSVSGQSSSVSSNNQVGNGTPPLPQAPLPVSDTTVPSNQAGANEASQAEATQVREWHTESGTVTEVVTTNTASENTPSVDAQPPLPQAATSNDSNRGIVSSESVPLIDVRGQRQAPAEQEQERETEQRQGNPLEQDWTQHAKERPIVTAFFESPAESWALRPGSLREQMLKWGNDSETWNVLWYGNNDYTIQVNHEVNGSLDEAVIEVISAFVAQGASLNIVRSRANNTIAIRSSQQ